MRRRMFKRLAAFGLVLVFCAICLTGCGSSSSSSSTSGPAPLAVMVGDVPLCGLLAFRTTVNGLTLTPQGSSAGVEVLTSNNTVPLDFGDLRDTSAILDITTIQPGTYTSGTIQLISPAVSVYDPTLTPPVSVITPSFSTETVNFNIDPPLVVPNCPFNSASPCKAAALLLDLNLAQTIPVTAQGQITTTNTDGTLTITATAVMTGTPLTASSSQGFGELDDVHGFILSVNNQATSSGTTNFIGSFTLQTLPGFLTSSALTGAGPALTVNLPSPQDLIGVSALNQLTTGNFVEVDGYVDQYGSFVANKAVIENQEDIANNIGTFEGYVLSVTKDASGNVTQFNISVTDEEPNTESTATSSNAVPFDTPPLIVNVSSSTGWFFSSPGVNYANLTPNPTYLAVGQRVVVHGTYVPPPSASSTGTAQSTSMTANDVYIPLQTITGNYASLISAGSDNATGGFVFSPCSALYQGQAVYVITNGQPGNANLAVTQFVNINGLAGLSPPPQLLVRGLLFLDQAGGTLDGIQIPANSYVLLANKVHQL